VTTEAGYDDHSSYPASVRMCASAPLWRASALLQHRRRDTPINAYGGYVKTCDFCGKQAEDEATTLTWSVAVENGRPRTFCETCSREHLRAMESQLDSEWW
jgi:hypothetical protein